MTKCKRFVGLDDSKAAIEVAVADEGRDGEVRRLGSVENSPEALRKLVRRLGRPKSLYFAYEAGPNGYGRSTASSWRSAHSASWQLPHRHRDAAANGSRRIAGSRHPGSPASSRRAGSGVGARPGHGGDA
jgi:hypothetical protein